MSHLAFFGEGTEAGPHRAGLYFEMRSGELNGMLPPNQMQLAMVPFHLAQNTDGTVSAVGDMTGAKFVTSNDGTETRNANQPSVYAIAGGNAICAEYNYQPADQIGANTQRYMQCFNRAGATIMPQTLIYAKLGDNCSMHQDAGSTYVVRTSGNVTKLIAWRGCNGNVADAGWLTTFTVTVDDAANPTSATFQQQMDVALCQEEERSRGFCTASTADPNTAICSWTEGNTQPQRDGTWLAAVDISDSVKGADVQGAILWKQQISGTKVTGEMVTFSVRAMHVRVMTPAQGRLDASDLIIWRSGQVNPTSGDRTDGGPRLSKGAYFGNEMAVMRVNRSGYAYVVPLTDMQTTLLGLDGTHLGMGPALFGTSGKLMPGVTFIAGSPLGGGNAAKVRAVGWDQAAAAPTLTDLGTYAIAPYDHSLYSNYLGANPGNQGRNYSGAVMIRNPYFGTNGNRDEYLSVITTTGKDPSEVSRPDLKLSSYITVLPTVRNPEDPNDPDDPDDPPPGGGSIGGCAAGAPPGSAVAVAVIVVLVAGIRRRKRTMLAVASIGAISGLMGCSGLIESDGSDGSDGSGDNTDAAAVAQRMFDETVYPTLEQKCVDCHDAAAPAGNSAGFVNRDSTKAYATAIGSSALVGSFAASSAPILLKIAAGHNGRTYSTSEAAAITAWLDKEVALRGAGSGDATTNLLATWSGCMTLAAFEQAGVAQAWGTLTAEDGQQCQACHVNGAEGFIATIESTKMFNVISSNKSFMQRFFSVDLSDPAHATVIINKAVFLAVSQAADPHREHPQFDATQNAGILALTQFYDATHSAMAASAMCGPSKLKN